MIVRNENLVLSLILVSFAEHVSPVDFKPEDKYLSTDTVSPRVI
jgi:hypothetical protein